MTDGEQAAAWQRDGYLMVRDAIAPEYLEPIRAFIGERVDAFARERHAAGDIATLHEQEPFGRRYAAIHEELSGRQQPQPPERPMFPVTDLCTRALYDLYTHPAITETLRVIVGPEVTLHGISVIPDQAAGGRSLVHPVASGQPLLQRAPDAAGSRPTPSTCRS